MLRFYDLDQPWMDSLLNVKHAVLVIQAEFGQASRSHPPRNLGYWQKHVYFRNSLNVFVPYELELAEWVHYVVHERLVAFCDFLFMGHELITELDSSGGRKSLKRGDLTGKDKLLRLVFPWLDAGLRNLYLISSSHTHKRYLSILEVSLPLL